MRLKRHSEPVVLVRCTGCGLKREIRAGEIPRGEVPMCSCGSPMATVSTKVKRAR